MKLLNKINFLVWVFAFAIVSGMGYSSVPSLHAESRDSVPLNGLQVQPPAQEAGLSVLHFIDSRLEKLNTRNQKSLKALQEAVADDPNSAYLHAELARNLAENNQFEQAALEIKEALQLSPKNPELHLLQAKLYSVKGQSQLAHQSYEYCMQLAPETEECYTMQAREYILHKNFPQAKALLEKYLKQDPSSVETLFLLASLYTEDKSQYPQAINYLELALAEDPKHLGSLVALAEIYLKEKNNEKALEALKRLERLAPDDVQTQLRLGLLYYENQQQPQAIQHFTRLLELEPKNDQVRYYLGLMEAQNKNFAQAAKYLEQIPRHSENYQQSLIQRSWALGAEGKYNEAIRAAKEILRKEKDNPEAYELLGTLYAKKHKYQKALQVYGQGLKVIPGQETLLFGKGVLLEKVGKLEEAIQVMKQILAKNPEHVQALNFVGYSYAERSIHLEESLQLLTRAHQLKPKDGYITDSLGWAYFQKGDLDQAKQYLETANRQSPEEPSILEHLGDLYLKLGDSYNAKQCYQAAVSAAVKENSQDKREKQELKRIQQKLSQLFSEK